VPAFVSGTGLSELGTRIEGDLVLPDDSGWDAARQAWNLAADQHPAAVVLVAGVEDIAAVIAFAREHEMQVAAQGTGHGATPLGSLEGVLLVKTGRLDAIEVDADAGRARIGAWVLSRDLGSAAQEKGLSSLPGSSPDVGVVGFTLGGGLGWLGRRYGLACNHVHAIEVVTADAEPRRVDAGSDPDLFWALRGGGGNFGVVIALELTLFPVPEVYAGSLILPAENGREIFQHYREWTETTPPELTSIARFLHPPPLEEIPEPLRDRLLVTLGACYIGGEGEGEELIAPLRELGKPIMDTFATIPAAQLTSIHMDPEQPVPGVGHSVLMRELTEQAVDAFVNATGPGSGSPLLVAELRQLGGALAAPAADAGALPCIEAGFVLNTIGSPMEPSQAAPINEHLDLVSGAMAEWATGGAYLNFTDRPAELDALFPADSRRRLTEVKQRWDPDGLLRANYAIGG
jgi:hypothetical protein